ncbi:histidinol-phosphate transaminase [Rhodococcus qingshengii]|uniref:histidinol-phosphate transaminase n=1 Tax=Rhodococcus erythropolis group TaxID=2840174 RepID=UPI001BDFBC54|nr:histidinol-phosphate transaminase [Rhodococcus qingshengii]
MTVRTRSLLDTYPGYVAGRTADAVAQNGGPTNAVKLSGNESCFGPLPGVRAAIDSEIVLNRYPDAHASNLCRVIAARIGLDVDQIVAASGSLPLCRSIVDAICEPGDEVMVPTVSFPAYSAAAALAGAVPVRVEMRGHELDLVEMANRVTERTRIVFICTPNNPTSVAVTAESLYCFLRQVPGDVLVVIDEAYREFVTDPRSADGIALLAEFSNVLVLRTFSKAYGLAGLRVGYSLSSPKVAAAIRKVTAAFSVNRLSESGAIAALNPACDSELERRVAHVVGERGRVTQTLRSLGHEVADSQANFVWLPMGPAANEYARMCEQRGVVIRPFENRGVRVTLSTVVENEVFLRVATQLARETR